MNNTQKMSPAIEMSIQNRRLDFIGHYIKELRIDQGMTQYEAASGIGISRHTLQNVEHGRNINLTTIFKLSDFFELSINEFFVDVE